MKVCIFEEKFAAKILCFNASHSEDFQLFSIPMTDAVRDQELASALLTEVATENVSQTALSIIIIALGNNGLGEIQICEAAKHV